MASKYLSAAEVATNRTVILAAYRHLLRATRLAFQGIFIPLLLPFPPAKPDAPRNLDDATTLLASRKHARDSFNTNRKLDTGSVEAGQALEHVQGVTQILRENVVQGRQVGEQGERYKLRMHEHTQRLDNETAGTLKGTTKSFREIKGERF